MVGESVTASPFTGRVIVVAGEGERIDRIVAKLQAGDALVAVVGPHAPNADVQAWFRVDPNDPEVWARVVPHVEQRLGPIDAAVTTTAIHAQVRDLLEPDLRRRGHGAVLDVESHDDIDNLLRTLATLL